MSKTNDHAPRGDSQPAPVRWARAAIVTLTGASTVAAIVESYVGLYEWALRHDLGHWAKLWPLLIDTPVIAGELMLLVAFMSTWSWQRKTLPWALVVAGLATSVAANSYHLRSATLTARATSAAAPIVACVMLAATLMLLKWTTSAQPKNVSRPGGQTVPVSAHTGPGHPPRQRASRDRLTPKRKQDERVILRLRTLVSLGEPLPSVSAIAREDLGNVNARRRAQRLLTVAQNGTGEL